jgi:hypothetical protein
LKSIWIQAGAQLFAFQNMQSLPSTSWYIFSTPLETEKFNSDRVRLDGVAMDDGNWGGIMDDGNWGDITLDLGI